MMPSRWSYITGTATDGVLAGPGTSLRGVAVNATAAATCTLYNAADTSDTSDPVAVIDLTDARSRDFWGIRLDAGLVAIVTADCDITVAWG